MALDLYWYDFICFGIVGFSTVGSIWVLLRKEGCREIGASTIYESLVANRRPQRSVGYVCESDLWKSCWRGVSPFWLMGVRFVSCLIMLGFMCWDVYDWTSSIFAYYTEWTFSLVIVYFAVCSTNITPQFIEKIVWGHYQARVFFTMMLDTITIIKLGINMLGTVVSAYGCWLHSTEIEPHGETNQFAATGLEENRARGTVTYLTKILKDHIWVRGHYAENELHERAGFFGYVLQAVYQTCGGAVILTDIVFWCVIFPFLSNAHFKLNLLMGCMHSLNIFFILVDTSLSSLKFAEISMVQIIIFCPLEFGLRYIPMGHARLRPVLVALPVPPTLESMGTFVVLSSSIASLALLRTVCVTRTSEIHHLSEIFSKFIFALII